MPSGDAKAFERLANHRRFLQEEKQFVKLALCLSHQIIHNAKAQKTPLCPQMAYSLTAVQCLDSTALYPHRLHPYNCQISLM